MHICHKAVNSSTPQKCQKNILLFGIKKKEEIFFLHTVNYHTINYLLLLLYKVRREMGKERNKETKQK